MHKFSIILPVRNGGEYIKECVNSILAQEYRNFKLQILENCSTDGTPEWLRSIDDPRVEIYLAAKPLSIEENWGRILSLDKNEFITLIGHDDLLATNYLTVMHSLIDKHPHAALYQTHFTYVDATGRHIRRCLPMDEVQTAAEFLSTFLVNGINIMGSGFMMRSADYDHLGGIPAYPNLLFADFELWVNLTLISYKATAFEECFSFRLHQSMTSTSKDIQLQKAFGQFVAYLKMLTEKNMLLKESIRRYGIQYIEFYCKSLAHRLLRTPVSKREQLTVAQFITQCKIWADELVPGNDFIPEHKFHIRLARQIDGSPVSRFLFLLFKKIYSKPVYK